MWVTGSCSTVSWLDPPYGCRGGTKGHPYRTTDIGPNVLILTWRQIFVDLTIGRGWLMAHRALGGLGGLSIWMVWYTITHYIWFCILLYRWFRIWLIIYRFVYHCMNGFVCHRSLHNMYTIWFFISLDKISKTCVCNIREKRRKRPNVGGVY